MYEPRLDVNIRIFRWKGAFSQSGLDNSQESSKNFVPARTALYVATYYLVSFFTFYSMHLFEMPAIVVMTNPLSIAVR